MATGCSDSMEQVRTFSLSVLVVLSERLFCMKGDKKYELKLSPRVQNANYCRLSNVFQQKSKTFGKISEIIMRFCLGLSQ